MQKMRQEYQQKSEKILKCGRFQKEAKCKDLYSLHSSLSEHQLLSGGARVQAHANPLYLNLGSLYHMMKMRAIIFPNCTLN
jgi:hypothetical protein